jgi:hypothetical protein
MRFRVPSVMIMLVCALCMQAQQPTSKEDTKPKTSQKDIDPLALQVLKAATEPIRQSQSFSFKVLVSREHLGSNGQVITLFHSSEATVQRPNKLHVDFHGRAKEVELFYNAGQAVLYTPEDKFYTQISGPTTLDAILDALEKRDVFLPTKNFLESDPYKSLTDDLLTGYVIGKVMLFDQPVHHLAFTEPGAEWQMWVVGGEHPQVRRLQVVDNSKPGHPRIVVDFFDWNFNASPNSGLFTFSKPADAKEIQLLKEAARK